MDSLTKNYKKSGVSLVGVLVAGGIMGFLAIGMATLFTDLNTNTKRVDLKVQSQNLDNLARLSMTTPANCENSLDLATRDIVIAKNKLPLATGSPENLSINIDYLKLADKKLGSNTEHGDLKINDITLVLPRPINIMEYVADLQIRTSAKHENSARYLSSSPIFIQFKDHPTDPDKVQISSCYAKAGTEPEQTCGDMGGQWLTGPYMPKSRCNLTGDLVLANNEGPDIVPFNGEISESGTRAVECYVQGRTKITVSTYSCAGRPGRRGVRCVFDTNIKQWVQRSYSSTGVAGALKRYCSKGVKMSMTSSGTELIDWNEPLSTAFNEPTFTREQELDHLNTITRCKYLAGQDSWLICKNSTTPNDAIEAKSGTCVFVNNVKLSGSTTQARINEHNLSCGDDTNCSINNKNDYTGWIYIDGYPRKDEVKKSGSAYYQLVTEARGRPCFEVEVNMSAAVSEDLTTRTLPPDATLASTPSNIRHCSIKNTSIANSGLENHHTLACQNQELSLDSDDSDESIVKGAGRLTKGQCWYVSNMKLGRNYYRASGNAGTPTTGSDRRYTGWVYALATVENNKYTATSSDNYIIHSSVATQMKAIPCTEGIRVMPSE